MSMIGIAYIKFEIENLFVFWECIFRFISVFFLEDKSLKSLHKV